MFRSCQIIISELRSLLKLYYNIHNLFRFCKQGVLAACCHNTLFAKTNLIRINGVLLYLHFQSSWFQCRTFNSNVPQRATNRAAGVTLGPP